MSPIDGAIQTPARAQYTDRDPRYIEAQRGLLVSGTNRAKQQAVSPEPRRKETTASSERRDFKETLSPVLTERDLALDDRPIRLHLELHEDTGDYVVELRDYRTGETICQLSPAALLDSGRALEPLRGILIDELA